MEKKPKGLTYKDYAIIALTFISIISVFAVIDARYYYDLSRLNYNGRIYRQSEKEVSYEELEYIQQYCSYTGTTCKKMKVYDASKSGNSLAVIYLLDQNGKFHSYGLVGGP